MNWKDLTTPEQLICGYFTALPLLWLAGALLPMALILVFGILARFVRLPHSYLLGLPWLLVALSQSVSVLYNMIELHQPIIMLAKHVMSSYVLGWYVLWASVCIGASALVRPEVFVRAAARVGYAFVILAIPAYAIAVTSRAAFLFILSPIGHLLPPNTPAAVFSFGIFVYVWEDFLGMSLPRLALFFPWSTAVGYAGLFLTFVMLDESNRRRRRLGMGAGLFMLVASMSRLGWLAFVACVACRWFCGLRVRLQVALCCGMLSLGLVIAIAGVPVQTAIDDARERFDSARPGASQAREAVYSATWDAIEKAPWLGYGWPGESTMKADINSFAGGDAQTMVIGSHSTVSGLIYKGGWITFLLFGAALASAIVQFVRAMRRTVVARTALAVMVGLILMATGEGVESLAVPILFAFMWLGLALLRSSRQPRSSDEDIAPILPIAHQFPISRGHQ